jgi:hypothetical protein
MRTIILLFALVGLFGSHFLLRAEDEPDAAMRAQWRRVFDSVALDYQLAHKSDDEALKLVARPTYTWARSGPHYGTYGSVYVWTDRGNAAAVGCFWRYPNAAGKASVVHELHSLSPYVLQSSGKDSSSWQPKAGVKRQLLPGAPVPAPTATGRLQQMRSLCRDFSARSVSSSGERTELRLLPQPLYRYESTNPDVIDGALFAFVCSIGTDPEVFLLLEALKTPDGPSWHYALARFSHMDLHANYKDDEIWQALRDKENTLSHSADHTYWVFSTPLEEPKVEAARPE